MNTSEKLYMAMCHNPNDWHLRDLQTVAKRRSIAWRQRGSHCIFTRPDGVTFPVPAHGKIKATYVIGFVQFAEGK